VRRLALPKFATNRSHCDAKNPYSNERIACGLKCTGVSAAPLTPFIDGNPMKRILDEIYSTEQA